MKKEKYHLIDNGTIVLLNSKNSTKSNKLVLVFGYFNDLIDEKIQYVGIPVTVTKEDDKIKIVKSDETNNPFIKFEYEDIIITIGSFSYVTEVQDALIDELINYNHSIYGAACPKVRKIGMTMQDAVDEMDYNKALYLAYKFDSCIEAKKWYNEFCDIEKYASLFDVSTRDIGRLKGAINNWARMTWGIDIKYDSYEKIELYTNCGA